ncbi:MAG: DUF2807 domain-containing protein [Bacteroidales bacterium]|nr:DUF2807 domain-containing protein [Bacteroidales bacterium]
MLRYLCALICTMGLICSCSRIEGDGILVKAMRPSSSFNEVDSRGEFELYLYYADSCKVEVECESNILQHVVTKFERNKLIVKHKNNVLIANNLPIKIFASTPFLKFAELSGSGKIIVDKINSDKLTLSLSGSGEIIYKDSVECETLTMDISGSGIIKAPFIKTGQTNIDIDGSGKCTIDSLSTEKLDIDIDGSGDINLCGVCDYVDLRVAGAGKLMAYDLFTKKYDIRINGSGCAYINVINELNILVNGSGNIYYLGYPRITMTGNGSGGLINMNP